MKLLWKWFSLLLALTLMLTACGGETPPADEDDGPDVNYEDYVQSVVDRKITDCITQAQVEAQLGYAVNVVGSLNDSTVSYQSEDGRHTLTLTMENMTRGQFDAITTDTSVVWTFQEGLGETAYWDTPHTELIAYQDGYGVSMSVYNIADAAMVGIMEIVLNNLYE